MFISLAHFVRFLGIIFTILVQEKYSAKNRVKNRHWLWNLMKPIVFKMITIVPMLFAGGDSTLIRSKDLECILVFRSAMPRGVTVVCMYVPILPSLHL